MRRPRNCPLTAACAVVLGGVGCYPVTTFLGRTAAVNPPSVKSESEGYGGGIWWEPESGYAFPYVYYHQDSRSGIGHGLELVAGLDNGAMLNGAMRWQIMGHCRGEGPPSRAFPDVCVEAGLTYELLFGERSLFAGVEASVPRGSRCWYVAFRKYYGERTGYDGDYWSFRHNIVFFGLEVSGTSYLEFFYMWTPREAPAHFEPLRAFGMNLVEWHF